MNYAGHKKIEPRPTYLSLQTLNSIVEKRKQTIKASAFSLTAFFVWFRRTFLRTVLMA